jgi:aldehyde:ferredoxin oxidoreductase
MDSIYRIDMTEGKVSQETVSPQYAGLGGRGLTSTIVHEEVHALCHPLSGENKLVLSPGLLSGTAAACSGRLSVGTKSPLTGTIKESNAGGTGADMLADLGVAAIIVEGAAPEGKLFTLKVSADGAELTPSDDLKGLGNYDTVARLTEAHGEKATYITIGQAGEMKMTAATVGVTDMENRPTRHAGRGGRDGIQGLEGDRGRQRGLQASRSGRPRGLQGGVPRIRQVAEESSRNRRDPAHLRHQRACQRNQ